MNELPTLPDPAAPQGAPQGAAQGTTHAAQAIPVAPEPAALRHAGLTNRSLTIASLLLAVLLAGHAFNTHTQMRKLREEMAQRLQKADTVNVESNQIVKSVQEGTRELQVKVGVLENRQQEAQSQQLALEQLYNDMSRNRDDWALAEIEQVLSTASQQLQLAGNVPGALIALQNADRSLSRSDKPQFITIRRAIARDAEKLKALPSVDSVGLAVRLDNVIAQVDTLPMLADATPAPAAPLQKKGARGGKPASPAPQMEPVVPQDTWVTRLQGAWNGWSSEMWTDVRQLVRVRTVDNPESMMLAPEHAYFLRENLKLRLLNARMALLSRNEGAFRTDLLAAQETLLRYFDTRARQTQTVQALLRQVQGSNLAIEMPTLADSLNAVRNYKAKP
ncbi:uroporphyrin-3 C-methyltransferase/uroporphyrinogen III methyltransferase/synthase [Pseudoduganella lurida]|uniref:Uroporphyrin-3 C-methyltransferase/uroporphyrinogen III methyltransferase/synthase n=1 Tax=Pseudoduganella lurida TaxID=1036180 RepID=A0A562RM17_9BURK|nr:uroporphyrinogen-III C-methyltransferase [Pseudoduganella lurida]TWI70085.1 uroporphyrin-3 C-methyltransferase/uroporphyrinogen III methyltransferase/synthase [Pseudoduganella lurida]